MTANDKPKNQKLIKKIGIRIATIRQARNISAQNLSEKSGISCDNLIAYESGLKVMTIDELAIIADVLSIAAFQFWL